eukprot:gene14420-16833_t
MPPDDIDVYEQRTLAAGAAQHGTANVLEVGEKTAAFFTLDGENNQIGVTEELPEINSLEEANMIVAKPPASTTHITQPCDVGNCFRGSKQALKLVKDDDVSQDKNIGRLETMLKSHIAKYTSTAAQRGKRANIRCACQVCKTRFVEIQRALSRSMHKDIIEDSFNEKDYRRCLFQPWLRKHSSFG